MWTTFKCINVLSGEFHIMVKHPDIFWTLSKILKWFLYTVKVHSDRVKEKGSIFFEVCRLFFDLFRFRRVWMSPSVGKHQRKNSLSHSLFTSVKHRCVLTRRIWYKDIIVIVARGGRGRGEVALGRAGRGVRQEALVLQGGAAPHGCEGRRPENTQHNRALKTHQK